MERRLFLGMVMMRWLEYMLNLKKKKMMKMH
jgi:hypothetical protein